MILIIIIIIINIIIIITKLIIKISITTLFGCPVLFRWPKPTNWGHQFYHSKVNGDFI